VVAEKEHGTVDSVTKSEPSWTDVEPAKLRPFKSTYYITMGKCRRAT